MIEDLAIEDRRASRMIDIIIPQTKIGAVAVLTLCALFGLILIKEIGWGIFLAWYCTVAIGIFGRQIFFKFLLSRKTRPVTKLRLISRVTAITGTSAIAVLPLFSHAISVSEVAVLSAIMVGWVVSSVSVLWVEPKVYAKYVLFNMTGIFLAWIGHVEDTSLFPLVFALLFGSALMINLSQLVSRQHYELERMTSSKGRLLAAANHDLRQPAHALGIFMSRLKERPGDRNLLDGAEASVKALLGMLDVYLDYSRMEANLQTVQFETFRIQNILDQLHLNFAESAAIAGTSLIIRPCNAPVQSDAVLLHQILLNFVANAIKFTPKGTVLVCCRFIDAGRSMRIDVLDSGIGIDPKDHERIFDEFFQCENSAGVIKGIGLGLSLVSEASRILKHPIALRSCPGKGSRFSVIVPVGHLEKTHGDATSNIDTSLVNSENTTILLVEDDPLGAAALKELLVSWGFAVHVAKDAILAIEMLKAIPKPDIFICDYRLPGSVNGIETVHRLRQTCGSMVPAFIISGEAEGVAKSEALEAGLTLLQKPVAPAKMRSLLHRIQVASMQSATK